ncbi:MAG: protein-tyrosine-phosphatase [Planctomycetes bacterium]|nr:protein-tyrosine-phosphatase [Planctomycetota bacterium]
MSGAARLADYVATRLREAAAIGPARRQQLDDLAADLADRLRQRGRVDLVFVCTHNSRRSQFAQVWAWTAARHFGLGGVGSWSGGTEVTAFAPEAIAALERAGFACRTEADGANPVRCLQGLGGAELRCWSKRFTDRANPRSDFVAVMTCSSADAACPAVAGAARRVPLVYEDPKVADGTPQAAATYDARCAEIARDLLCTFGRVAARLA